MMDWLILRRRGQGSGLEYNDSFHLMNVLCVQYDMNLEYLLLTKPTGSLSSMSNVTHNLKASEAISVKSRQNIAQLNFTP